MNIKKVFAKIMIFLGLVSIFLVWMQPQVAYGFKEGEYDCESGRTEADDKVSVIKTCRSPVNPYWGYEVQEKWNNKTGEYRSTVKNTYQDTGGYLHTETTKWEGTVNGAKHKTSVTARDPRTGLETAKYYAEDGHITSRTESYGPESENTTYYDSNGGIKYYKGKKDGSATFQVYDPASCRWKDTQNGGTG